MRKVKLKMQRGFTIPEFMISVLIGVIFLGIVLGMWQFTHRSWTVEQQLVRSRVDLQMAMERIKEEMRLSSLNYTSFYPSSGPPYTAVSFPLATHLSSPNSAFLDLDDSTGNIDWDKSVIYFLYDASGNKKLKRTVITSNKTYLTDTDKRYDQVLQLATAITEPDGAGSSNHPSSLDNKSNASTTTVIENVSSFTLTPTYRLFDGYSATTQRSDKMEFGVVNLDSTYDSSSGYHDFKFEIVGTSGTDYKMGIDSICITPSGCEREAEVIALNSATGSPLLDALDDDYGGSASTVTASGWSGNQYLEYSSGDVGDYINMRLYYDLYRESNFDGATKDNTYLTGDNLYIKLGDFEEGEGVVSGWTAALETGGTAQGYYDLTPTSMANITARNLISSAKLQSLLGTTTYDMARVKFVSHPTTGCDLQITSAYIAERDSTTSNQNATDTKTRLYFTDASENITPGTTITAGSSQYSNWTIFGIDPTKDYFVTFHVTGTVADSYASYWPGATLGETNSYLLVYDPPSDQSAVAAWPAPVDETSVNPPAELPVAPVSGSECTITRNIYAVEGIEVYRKTGSVLSDIYDSQAVDADKPDYAQIGWRESAGTDATTYAGSSDDSGMTGAIWDSASGSNPHSLGASIDGGKFVQSAANFSAEPYWKCLDCGAIYTDAAYKLSAPSSHLCTACSTYLAPAIDTPWVDDVTVNWPGGTQLCEVSGYFTQKSDYGIIKLTVDGLGFTKGIDLSVTISDTFPSLGKTYETSLITSAEPRNTGR